MGKPFTNYLYNTNIRTSGRTTTGGTGLGLAIVKHIARIHNARIKLESQVDVGTTITVTFPTAS